MKWSIAVGLLLVAAASPVLASGDPWYVDMAGHWSEAAVRALWEEDVADGNRVEVNHGGTVYVNAWFRPNSPISRGEHTMLVARVFDLSPWPCGPSLYSDLGPNLLLYGSKPAFGWVEAAARAGIMGGYADGTFRPHLYLDRGSAIRSLVLALGLEDFALSLSPGQVTLYLSRFSDAWSIDPANRHLVAAAVYLRILRGYPDRTLRLNAVLLRGEAASLIYRSCLFRLSPPGSPFYPDGDGFDDETSVQVHSLRNRNVATWTAEITDARGLVLWTTAGAWGPPLAVTWDGRDSAARVMPAGTYFAQGRLLDLQGNVYEAVPVPVYLEQRSLTGYMSPSSGPAGTAAVITCFTTGRPGAVRVVSPDTLDLDRLDEASSYSNTWQASWTSSGAGPINVNVVADFGPVTRLLTLPFTVVSDMSLAGWLEPDTLPGGATMAVHAATTGDVLAVTATGPHGQPSLNSVDGATWIAHHTIPLDAMPGPYSVTLTAVSASDQRQLELVYRVDGSLRDRVEFVLTD